MHSSRPVYSFKKRLIICVVYGETSDPFCVICMTKLAEWDRGWLYTGVCSVCWGTFSFWAGRKIYPSLGVLLHSGIARILPSSPLTTSMFDGILNHVTHERLSTVGRP